MIAWPCPCDPVVAHGSTAAGRPVTVVLHPVSCQEPVEDRHSLTYATPEPRRAA